MLSSFSRIINSIDLDFHRFLADGNEVQYVVTYMAFTKEEVLMLFKKNVDGYWRFIYKSTTPPNLQILESGIDEMIKENETSF